MKARLVSLSLAVMLAAAPMLSITGCAMPAAAGAAAQTPEDRFSLLAADILAVAREVVFAARTALDTGKITPADAENIATAAETAQKGVAVARQIAKEKGPAAAQSRLRIAASALDQFALYLGTRATTGAK